jgi:uncharacterized protein YbjT (DUF2867 family)
VKKKIMNQKVMNRKVVIFGATGAQGAPVVREALAEGMTVRAVARDAARVAAMHPEAEAHGADLSDAEALRGAMSGVDAAFVHLPMPSGPQDAQTWLEAIIRGAHGAGLPLMVFSTSGPAGEKYPSSMVIDGTTAGARAVSQCGIPAIVLRPAIYLENLLPPLFAPLLRQQGLADYPPLRASQKVMWTSHLDQARIAVAAMARPDLAGNSYDIGSPDALGGEELAVLLGGWLGRPVRFAPITPTEFGQRVAEVLGNPGIAMALSDLYGALAQMPDDGMVVDTAALEQTFEVQLTPVADHIAAWPTG